MTAARQLFVLSPASLSGARARRLLDSSATSSLARRLRSAPGVPVGELFRAISGLYFRGKLEYAEAFATPTPNEPGAWVVLPGFGLWPVQRPVDLPTLKRAALVRVTPVEPRYADPLRRGAEKLAHESSSEARVVFLGSVSTDKYVPLLSAALGSRLQVPRALIGVGMMQRGALLRRCAAERDELEYVPAPTGTPRGPARGV